MMRSLSVVRAVGGGLAFLLFACGDSAFTDIAVVTTESFVADSDMRAQTAESFYRLYPDDYDMLVLWGGAGIGPASSYYLPVQNDVTGLGYQHTGTELFDDSSEFGSSRLQGIIWMGPDWLTNTIDDGPDSTLGILAQETAHRWEATVWFSDEEAKSGVSEDLLGDGPHWSFFLDTGASPLGGNEWTERDDGCFTATPVDTVEFSQLDLYLMGLIPAGEVEPLPLLFDIRDENGNPNSHFNNDSQRVTGPAVVCADVEEVTIEQIIDIEGERGAGFDAGAIRQAWIYVSTGTASVDDLDALETLRLRWSDFFGEATGGRGDILPLLR